MVYFDESPMNELSYTIELLVGDPFGDGHEKYVSKIIYTNLSQEKIEQAYKDGVEILGFDFSKIIARKYEEHSISIKYINILIKHDFDISILDDFNSFEEKVNYYLTTDDYVNIWLFFVKVGDGEFKYEKVELPSIHIGGYIG